METSRRCCASANFVPCRREHHRPPDHHRHRHVDGREGRTGERDRVEAEDLTWRRRTMPRGAGPASLVLALGSPRALHGASIPATVNLAGTNLAGRLRGSIPSAADLYAADGAGRRRHPVPPPESGLRHVVPATAPAPSPIPAARAAPDSRRRSTGPSPASPAEAQARWTARSRSDRRADRHRRRQATRRSADPARLIREQQARAAPSRWGASPCCRATNPST